MYLYMDIEPSSYCLSPNKRYVAYIVNVLHHSNLSSLLQYLQAIHKHVVSVLIRAKTWKCDLEIFTAFGNIFCILCEQHNDKSRRKHIPRVILQVTTRFHDTLCSPSTILKIFQIERKLIQMTLKITGRKKI